MESISESMQFTDVVIVTADERLRAHRAILASHSTYLQQLMISNLQDLGGADDPTLVLKDVSADHMKLMMQFFYTGEVSLTSQSDIQPLQEVTRLFNSYNKFYSNTFLGLLHLRSSFFNGPTR